MTTMAKRAPSIIFALAISFGIVSCRSNPWFLSSTATGAVFVGTRPEGEVVKTTIRSSRAPRFGVLTLTPDSPDGGTFPVEPPIAVRLESSAFTIDPLTLDDTSRRVMLMKPSGTSCGPCSVDLDLVFSRTSDGGAGDGGGAPPIGVRWSVFSSIGGERDDEEKVPDGENITVVPR
jgi:hypothetical protein